MTSATTAKLATFKHLSPSIQTEASTKWASPRVIEIPVGLEINSYACAERN